jgi:hypothetical protein
MYARAAAGYALRHPDDNEMHAPIGVAKLAAIFDAMAAEDLVYQEEEDDDA